MKPRTTLFLLIAAAAAFLGIRLYERSHLPTRESETREAEVLPGFDRAKLHAIEIRNGDENLVLKKEGDAWFLDVPVHDRADMGAVTRLLTSLESLSSKARIDQVEKDKIKEYGLDKPSIRVKFEGEGDLPSRLTLGDDTAATEHPAFYARADDRDTVFVVEGDLKQQLSQTPAELRDRRLMSGRVSDADRMVVHLSGGEIEVKREDDQWALVKPFKARGDAQKIRDIIAALTNARVEKFVSEGKEAEDDGLAEPVGTVDLYFSGRDEPETINFGKPSSANPGNIHVALNSRIGVFQVGKETASVLEKKPADLRDRSLVRINPDIIDRITITPAEGAPVQLARKEEDWIIRSSGDAPANGPEILQFIEKLRNYQVQDFVAESASELEKFGLAQPKLKISFSSFASENTAESAAGENEITQLILGEKDGQAFAKIAEEPFIVKIEPSLLAGIPTSASAWRSLVVTDLDPSTINSIELQRMGADPIHYERQQGAWSSSGMVMDPVTIQSLANTLAKLRAVRWIGDTAPDQGLADPMMKVTMTLGEKTRTLLVGNRTPAEMHFAQFAGEPGVFLINQPDFNTIAAAFPAPEQPAPSASPVPAAAPSKAR